MPAPTLTSTLLQSIQQAGDDRWWHPDDITTVNANPLTVDALLARLAKRGELHRVRRGLYWRGHQGLFGRTVPSEDDMITAVVGDIGIGPGGLSASNDLGLTTQVPGRSIVAVPRRAPRSLPRITFVGRAGRIGRVQQNLNQTEVAVLEVLSDWDQLVEIDDDKAIKRLVGLIDDGHIRPDKMVAASVSESADTRWRLRGLLAAAGRLDDVAAMPLPRTAHAHEVRQPA